VEGFDEDLKMRTLRWWGAVDLRRSAAETETRRRRAARERWGREGGDGVLASGAGFIGGSKPTGHAAGFDVSLAKTDGVPGDGGRGEGIAAKAVSDALHADRARNRRLRRIREAVAAENLARREAAAAEAERLAREQRAAEEAARLAKRAKKFGQ
jgi:hypothetical protein